MLKGLPFQELHSYKRLAFVLTNIVDRANIRMVERGCRLSLSPKTLQCLLILNKRRGEELERNEPMQPGILRLINDSHTPATQSFQNIVMRKDLAQHCSSPITIYSTVSGKPAPTWRQGSHRLRRWGAIQSSSF